MSTSKMRFKYFFTLFLTRIKKGVLFCYEHLIVPSSTNEDSKRQEFILNILLLGIIMLSLVSTIKIFIDTLPKENHPSIPLEIFIWIPIFFIILLASSRKGYFRLASYIFIGSFFPPLILTVYRYGIDLPQVLLTFALIIVMSGILISARFAILITVGISLFVLFFAKMQISQLIVPNSYWRQNPFGIDDAIVLTSTILIIALVSWLSNRELEKSLTRALASEIALQEERDLLEIKVEERTKEIKAMEAEKSMQLHRFAEFGKMASGLFHDLANPLTAAMLHMENLKKKYGQAASINSIDLNKVFKNIEQVKTFTEAARKQIQDQENIEDFSLPEEINLAIKTMSFKAKRAQVKIIFSPQYTFKICGNSVKFYRIICDLLSNAIDAYSATSKEPDTKREILITLSSDNNQVFIDIQDWGCGIKKDYQEKIFQPLFSTKKSSEGTGLGLYISKNIIEKDFGGNIIVQSQEGQGSNFTIKIPIKNYHGGAKCV